MKSKRKSLIDWADSLWHYLLMLWGPQSVAVIKSINFCLHSSPKSERENDRNIQKVQKSHFTFCLFSVSDWKAISLKVTYSMMSAIELFCMVLDSFLFSWRLVFNISCLTNCPKLTDLQRAQILSNLASRSNSVSQADRRTNTFGWLVSSNLRFPQLLWRSLGYRIHLVWHRS